jgi:hypothetical protein
MTDAQLDHFIATHRRKEPKGSKILNTLKAAPNAIGGHFANEALFDAPKVIPAVRRNLEQSEREHPVLSGIGKGLGMVAGLGTGGAVGRGAGALMKIAGKSIRPVGKALRAASKASPLVKSMGAGAGYGALSGIGGGIGSRDLNAKDVARSAGTGALFGAGAHGAGKVVKGIVPAARKRTGAAKALRSIEKPEIERSKNLKLGETLIDRGSPKTLGTANALRHADENVQGMFEKRMRGLTAGNKKQAYDLVDKHMGPGNINKFNAGMDRLSETRARPHYQQAFKHDVKNLPMEVEGDPHYRKALDKVFGERNKVTEIGRRPDNYEYQDRVKRMLHSQEKASRIKGDDYAANKFGSTRHNLTKALREQNPHYAKALDTSGKYIRAKEAGALGQIAFDPSVRVRDIAAHRAGSRYGHKMGAKDAMMKQIEGYKSSEGNIAEKLNAPHVAEKLKHIIGPERHSRFAADVDKLSTKHRNFHNLTRGSQTSKNEADIGRNKFEDAAKSAGRWLLRPRRAAINTAARTAGKLNSGVNTNLAAGMMLHPQHIGRVQNILKKKNKIGKLLKHMPKMAARYGTRRRNEEDY